MKTTHFFHNIFNHLSDFHCVEIIIGGDFNQVLDTEKGKKGGLARTHQKALKVVQDFSENFDLTDVWRVFNPETKRYTWRQRQPDIQCRQGMLTIYTNHPVGKSIRKHQMI